MIKRLLCWLGLHQYDRWGPLNLVGNKEAWAMQRHCLRPFCAWWQTRRSDVN